jgi:hypothetical protein
MASKCRRDTSQRQAYWDSFSNQDRHLVRGLGPAAILAHRPDGARSHTPMWEPRGAVSFAQSEASERGESERYTAEAPTPALPRRERAGSR